MRRIRFCNRAKSAVMKRRKPLLQSALNIIRMSAGLLLILLSGQQPIDRNFRYASRPRAIKLLGNQAASAPRRSRI